MSGIRSKGASLWPASVKEAQKIQELLGKKIKLTPLKDSPRLIASVDAAFGDDNVIAAACCYTFPGLEKLGEAVSVMKCRFPYVPGYLSFREGPAVIDAIEKLGQRPDLIIFDGQGIAHPRGIGLASHIGVILDIPSIGSAKSRLVGEFKEPGKKRGQWSPLLYDGRTVGAVLRTKDGVRPLFISPGHRIDLKGSIEIILACAKRYRLPEPQRCADMAAGRAKTHRIDLLSEEQGCAPRRMDSGK